MRARSLLQSGTGMKTGCDPDRRQDRFSGNADDEQVHAVHGKAQKRLFKQSRGKLQTACSFPCRKARPIQAITTIDIMIAAVKT